jgi:hypothetical protein
MTKHILFLLTLAFAVNAGAQASHIHDQYFVLLQPKKSFAGWEGDTNFWRFEKAHSSAAL